MCIFIVKGLTRNDKVYNTHQRCDPYGEITLITLHENLIEF